MQPTSCCQNVKCSLDDLQYSVIDDYSTLFMWVFVGLVDTACVMNERGKDSEYDFTSLQCCNSQKYHMVMAVNAEITNKHDIEEECSKITNLLQNFVECGFIIMVYV